ncbi:response regulator transcription factor [Hymenobacter busanensis]|uniref:Response regulator transcription factor n=1 Tax=Hymenobacter busanensis TaxID=2607656 RepID=A0A7L4ZXE9_9BACT|nr:response regulator transcription factor [Hymenobacter busanensis]KAA9333140.1 response regulator transcription factor [Hymenobacter busanensis]QHJ08184.1 response regulator [Hymenobacter busanensis]
MRILVVEDETRLASFVQQGLTQAGHTADVASSGPAGLELAAAVPYDAILLDMMLPGQNGLDVLRNLREFGIATPVIIVSALTDTQHVIRGLDAGAVDYLRKPFEFDELLARLRIVQRRGPTTTDAAPLRVADLELDLVQRRVTRAGQPIALTNREFALLELLLRHPGRVVSKTRIAEKVWDVDFDMGSNVIEVHMSQLRKKIDRGFAEPLLETVVGQGYRLRDPATRV